MTDEERRAKQREAYKRWREKHPRSDEERARSRELYRLKKEMEAAEAEEFRKSTARHKEADPPKKKPKTQKEIRQEKERRLMEDEEARALGLSYGKYQSLKHLGKLPENIPLPEKKKVEKLGVYVPPEKGLGEFNATREAAFAVAAARINEERRLKRQRAAYCDAVSGGYLERMRIQKEVVERARSGTNQGDC